MAGRSPHADDVSTPDVVPDDAPDRVDRVEAGWRRERPDIDVSSVGIVTRIWRIGRHKKLLGTFEWPARAAAVPLGPPFAV